MSKINTERENGVRKVEYGQFAGGRKVEPGKADGFMCSMRIFLDNQK